MTRLQEIVLTAVLSAAAGALTGVVSASVAYGQLKERTAQVVQQNAELQRRVDALEKRPQPADLAKTTCLELAKEMSRDFANDTRIKEAMRQAGCTVAE